MDERAAADLNEVISARLETIRELCREHRVRRLDLFGSGAGRRFNPATSDLDFVIEFQPMPPAEHADHYFSLLEGIEALLGRPVDLIEAGAIRNPYFRRSVDETRVTIYAAA